MADHPHTIDRWDNATGENLIEQIAAVGDYGSEIYRAAAKRWPKDKITLRNRAAPSCCAPRARFSGRAEAPYAEAAKGAAAVQFELDEVRPLSASWCRSWGEPGGVLLDILILFRSD